MKLCQYEKDLLSIWFLPDQFVTQEMWNIAKQRDPWMFEHILDQYKTQEMCNEAVRRNPWMLEHVPDIKLKQCAIEQYKVNLRS